MIDETTCSKGCKLPSSNWCSNGVCMVNAIVPMIITVLVRHQSLACVPMEKDCPFCLLSSHIFFHVQTIISWLRREDLRQHDGPIVANGGRDDLYGNANVRGDEAQDQASTLAMQFNSCLANNSNPQHLQILPQITFTTGDIIGIGKTLQQTIPSFLHFHAKYPNYSDFGFGSLF